MGEHSRYNVGNEEGNGVLKNKLNITDPQIIQDTETLLLSDTYEEFFRLLKSGKLIFNLKLLFKIHKYFLSTLYVWAGKIRSVEISKEGILFCASSHIEKELKKLEVIIKNNLPLQKENKRSIGRKLAIIHCEFNAIHPFREGNGRTVRLFLDLLAVNHGFSLIDYNKSSEKEYINACIGGMSQSYSQMEKIIYRGI